MKPTGSGERVHSSLHGPATLGNMRNMGTARRTPPRPDHTLMSVWLLAQPKGWLPLQGQRGQLFVRRFRGQRATSLIR